MLGLGLSLSILALIPRAPALPTPPQSPLPTARIPTAYESAIEARQILATERYAVLSTVFPRDPSASEHRPAAVAGLPVGLPEYIADCEGTGSPTLLAIGISTSARNWAAGSNVSVAVGSHDGAGREWGSAAAHPRFTLFGYVEAVDGDEAAARDLQACFLGRHGDARAWLPGNAIHASYWARVVVTEVYWIGGFGDRAYIGWIGGEEWRDAGRELAGTRGETRTDEDGRRVQRVGEEEVDGMGGPRESPTTEVSATLTDEGV